MIIISCLIILLYLVFVIFDPFLDYIEDVDGFHYVIWYNSSKGRKYKILW